MQGFAEKKGKNLYAYRIKMHALFVERFIHLATDVAEQTGELAHY